MPVSRNTPLARRSNTKTRAGGAGAKAGGAKTRAGGAKTGAGGAMSKVKAGASKTKAGAAVHDAPTKRARKPMHNISGGHPCGIAFYAGKAKVPLFSIPCTHPYVGASKFLKSVRKHVQALDARSDDDEEEDGGGGRGGGGKGGGAKAGNANADVAVRLQASAAELRLLQALFETPASETWVPYLAPLVAAEPSAQGKERVLVRLIRTFSMLLVDELDLRMLWAYYALVDDALTSSAQFHNDVQQGRPHGMPAWTTARTEVQREISRVRPACPVPPRVFAVLARMHFMAEPLGMMTRFLKDLCPPPSFTYLTDLPGMAPLLVHVWTSSVGQLAALRRNLASGVGPTDDDVAAFEHLRPQPDAASARALDAILCDRLAFSSARAVRDRDHVPWTNGQRVVQAAASDTSFVCRVVAPNGTWSLEVHHCGIRRFRVPCFADIDNDRSVGDWRYSLLGHALSFAFTDPTGEAAVAFIQLVPPYRRRTLFTRGQPWAVSDTACLLHDMQTRSFSMLLLHDGAPPVPLPHAANAVAADIHGNHLVVVTEAPAPADAGAGAGAGAGAPGQAMSFRVRILDVRTGRVLSSADSAALAADPVRRIGASDSVQFLADGSGVVGLVAMPGGDMRFWLWHCTVAANGTLGLPQLIGPPSVLLPFDGMPRFALVAQTNVACFTQPAENSTDVVVVDVATGGMHKLACNIPGVVSVWLPCLKGKRFCQGVDARRVFRFGGECALFDDDADEAQDED